MTNLFKAYVTKPVGRTASLLLLYNILLINGCGCNNSTTKSSQKENTKTENTVTSSLTKSDEIIIFCGNLSVGKSALCNSIFQQGLFKSGICRGKGLTTRAQEYMHKNKLYIDTPGLDNIGMRAQAAQEIEKALKHNNNYKIVFVVTLKSGRIKPNDLVTINVVCDAIQTNFEYGLIFNKVSRPVYQDITENGLDEYLITLHKKPGAIIMLKRDDDIDDAADMYFPNDSENKERLMSFLCTLRANRILENEVKQIDIRDFEARVKEMEESYARQIAELNKNLKEAK